MANNNSNNDVDVDAQPEEDDQTIHNDEDHLQDNNIFSKTRTHQEATASGHTVATSQSHGNNFNELVKYFPQHLREDYYIDLLVIHTEADYEDAKAFKDCIEKNVKFCEHLTPHVALLDDVITDFPFLQLDDAFLRSVYILMYVTEQFCKDFDNLSKSHACLEAALTSPNDRKAIIAVYTSPEQWRPYKLPMMLRNLQPLNYFNQTFIQGVINLVENKSDLILKRNYNLEKARQKYFEANRDELSKMERSLKSSVNISKTKKKEKSEGAQSSEDSADERVKDGDLKQQPKSQFSVSTKPKCVVGSGNIESDGDVSERRTNP